MTFDKTQPLEDFATDHGSIGPLTCPHCATITMHLVEVRAKSFFGIFNLGSRWIVRCLECGFDEDLTKGEVMDAKMRAEAVRAFLDKKMDQDTFAERLYVTSFPTLGRIEDMAATWECAACKEIVPDNFETCWKCSEDRPGLVPSDEPVGQVAQTSGFGDEVLGIPAPTIQSEQTHAEDEDVTDVTAAIITQNDRVLIARRKGGRHAGEWEFPGGKVEGGESPEECLRRELQEEFGVDSEIGVFIMANRHEYEFGIIRLLAYDVRLLSDDLELTAHDAIEWVEPRELSEFALLPADVPIAEALAKASEK